MPVLAKIIERFRGFVPSSSPPCRDDLSSPDPVAEGDLQGGLNEATNTKSGDIDAKATPRLSTQGSKNQRKRKSVTPRPKTTNKRSRLSQDICTSSPLVDGDEDESKAGIRGSLTNKKSLSTKALEDRNLMPPPPTLSNQSRRGQQRRLSEQGWVGSDDNQEVDSETSIISTANRRRLPELDPYDMEQARRHAAAVKLPANSGIWTPAEQDLFYHLALRGFEPLLPRNWMLDFKTLPLSLFTHEDSKVVPIIHNIRDTEFRAIRSLRELVEIGKDIRDRTLASPGFKTEAYIERAVNKYISWALTDAGFGTGSHTLPFHIVVRMKRGQTTSDTITELTRKLHDLAALHRDARGVHSSIEEDDSISTSHDETRVIPDDAESLPILTGLMIVSSVIVLFTFNSHTAAPVLKADGTNHSKASRLSTDKHMADLADEPGLRLITTFDFSNFGLDVWNALSVAIVAMHIRKVMTESNEAHGGMVGDEMMHHGANSEDEDPDI